MGHLTIIVKRITRQCLKQFLSLFRYFKVTILAYYNAIFFIESSPVFSGNYLARKPLIFFVVCLDFLTTSFASSTTQSTLLNGALSTPCILDRLIVKFSRHNHHPFTGWIPSCANPNDSYYVVNGKRAGIIITPVYEIFPLQFDIGSIPTMHECYSIYLQSEKRTIIGNNNFKEVRRLAEWYYKEKTMSTQMVQYPAYIKPGWNPLFI